MHDYGFLFETLNLVMTSGGAIKVVSDSSVILAGCLLAVSIAADWVVLL